LGVKEQLVSLSGIALGRDELTSWVLGAQIAAQVFSAAYDDPEPHVAFQVARRSYPQFTQRRPYLRSIQLLKLQSVARYSSILTTFPARGEQPGALKVGCTFYNKPPEE
jgi:hypothetical protein